MAQDTKTHIPVLKPHQRAAFVAALQEATSLLEENLGMNSGDDYAASVTLAAKFYDVMIESESPLMPHQRALMEAALRQARGLLSTNLGMYTHQSYTACVMLAVKIYDVMISNGPPVPDDHGMGAID